MVYKTFGACALGWSLLAFAASAAETASDAPKPVPATRPEVKVALDALKDRQPRLPLPPPTDEDRKNAGEWGVVNNGRMRAMYLPKAWLASGFGQDPSMTLDQVLKVECFWIVSRGNNCQYCLGHQEHRLAHMMGLAENRIASLDADWSVFLPQEQAAFGLARKLTLEPHAIGDADVDALRPFYNDKQIVELTFAIANFNSMNRWTDGMGIPQDRVLKNEPVLFDAPTDARFAATPSLCAPRADAKRPPLESAAEVAAALSACRERGARVAIASEAEARAALPSDWPTAPLPNWVRALAIFPKTGVGQIGALTAVQNEGRLDNLLKARLAWTCARHNRAWYALGHAQRRLAALDQSDDAMYALDSRPESLPAGVRAALAFAEKSTVKPATIADGDIARLRKHFSDHETAEIVYVVCAENMFDRLTETLALPLEAE